MTLRDLIDTLTDLADEWGDEMDVRLAHQPRWPLEYSIGAIAATVGAPDHDDEQSVGIVAVAEEPVVYIGEGQQLGYLGGAATRVLGWRE